MKDDNEYRRQCLIRLIESFGEGGVTRLAKQLGKDSTYVSRMKSDPSSKQHRPITGDTVLAISKLYPAWLSPSSDTNTTANNGESNAEPGPRLGLLLRTPVVGMAQLGDNGFWAELETPAGFGDGYIPFPAKSRQAYALRCRGDSMKPRIKNGEFVVVDPDIQPAPGDEVLVKSKDGRVMVKELLYIRDGTVHLLSVNEAHGKMSIPMNEVDFLHAVAGIMPAHTWTKD